MTRLVDLTVTLDPANRAKLPPPLAGAASVVAPTIEYLHPASQEGRDEFCVYLGCPARRSARWRGLGRGGADGHVVALRHARRRAAAQWFAHRGPPARTITDIALDELYRPGLVLDVRPWAKLGEEITIAMLDRGAGSHRSPHRGGRCGADPHGPGALHDDRSAVYAQPGISRAEHAAPYRQGATILGTDAVGWDLPFRVMAQKFSESGDK